MKNNIRLAILALCLPLALLSQEFRGAIGGLVTDPTGAAVAGAKILVTEINTQVRGEAVSDASGNFTIPLLLAGDYNVVVRVSRFKEALRKGVHLGAGEHPNLDIHLEAGDMTQTVEVTAEVPLINSQDASVGEAITTKEIEDLPSNGGAPTAMVFLAPGVILTSQPSQILPFASGGAASFSMGGMPQQQNELLVDGVPNTTWDGRLAYSPPREAVQQVRTKVFDTDSTYGRTAGGTANTILKSGTNALHGSVAYYNQPNNLVANDFFRNKAGQGGNRHALQSGRAFGQRPGVDLEAVRWTQPAVLDVCVRRHPGQLAQHSLPDRRRASGQWRRNDEPRGDP